LSRVCGHQRKEVSHRERVIKLGIGDDRSRLLDRIEQGIDILIRFCGEWTLSDRE